MVIKDYVIESIESSKFPHYPQISSLGYEYRTINDFQHYSQNCYKNSESICIFQYTISGSGILEINNKKHLITKGDVFMIERPGPYKYYLPENSDVWEIKFISFNLSSIPFWNSITGRYGRIFKIKEDSDILKFLDEIITLTENASLACANHTNQYINIIDPFDSVFDNSYTAYKFLMMLHNYLYKFGTAANGAESVQLCIEFINTNFHKNIDNLDIANAGFISPYYLNKRFKDVIGETPLSYLTKTRIKQAAFLLQNPSNTIDNVAKSCGFQNANYFAKVFKKFTGVSPSEYRESKKIKIF